MLFLFVSVGLTLPLGMLRLAFGKGDDFFISIGVMTVIFLLWYFVRLPKTKKQKQRERAAQVAYEKEMEEYQEQMKEYHWEMRKWQHSFICERCNHVFQIYDD